MSYEKYYPNGWQSGETGGTPITPEALNHMEQGIANLDSEKAPAGYGLGAQDSKQLTTADDLNNCAANGFYSWASAPINAPFNNGIMIIATYDWARKVQLVWCAENGCIIQRIQYGGLWDEWEWVNPPMVQGVEYRTTERYSGKPVYAVVYNYGHLTAGTAISSGLTKDCEIIEAHVLRQDTVNSEAMHIPIPQLGFGDTASYYGWGWNFAFSSITTITFTKGEGATASGGFGYFKYTKKTN